MLMRLLASALLALTLAVQSGAPADLAIVNARVFTGVPAQPWAEAVSIRANRIEAVGTSAAIRTAGAARIVDAGGRLLIPGINDAHTHPGAMPEIVQLEGPPAMEQDPPLDEVLARIRKTVAAAPQGRWILGEIGANALDDPRATRAVLDPLTPDRPLMLYAWTGHGAILNTAALRALGVSDTEPDPAGGWFGRADGRLTGLAHEYADYLIAQRLSMIPDRAAQVKAMQQFAAEAVTFGITSVQAMMTAYPMADAAPWIESANLPIRTRLIDFPLTPMKEWRAPAGRRVKAASPLVTASGTKWVLDGTPIERLALLRAPYADAPKTSGRANMTGVELREFLRRAYDAKEQPLLHAVGDGAIALALDSLQDTGGARWLTLRPRLEHADMIQAADFARAARMGVTLVQNPSHFTIAPILRQRLGAERLARTDLVKSAIAAGVPFAIGSDGPLNPFLNIMFAAANAANPSQALTVEQALTAYTKGSAFAEFAERQKGTIAPGMLADLALLSQDIFKVPAPELPRTTSLLTIVNGRIVHEAKPAAAVQPRAPLTAMSFNIRYGTANDGDNRWPLRRDFLIDVLREQSADIIGLQEALDFQIDEIVAALPAYAVIGTGRDDGARKGEYAAILFRRDRFQVSDAGTFWFSDTPEAVASKSWGNRITRICTWARLVDRDGRAFWHYNVHLDHESQPSRERSAALLRSRIAGRRHPDEPVVVTGDFNAGEQNAAVTTMVSGGALVDTFRVRFPDERVAGTFSGFDAARTGGEKIDYVFVPPGTEVMRAEIVRSARSGRTPSDHFPVIAQIRLPASAK
ncbi:MAG TPA: amidohydrolase family protein [Vicinamibacterales bacterium]|nr:amidohydrolase family protein [Vicinamibacterales bacterium]